MKPKIVQFLVFLALFSVEAKHELSETISSEVEILKITHKIPLGLTKAVKSFNQIRDRKLANDIFCESCDLVVSQIIEYRSSGASKDSMTGFFRRLCRAFTDWGAIACQGYIEIEADTILHIIDNRKGGLTPKRACAIYFQTRGCQDPQANKWVIPIPPVKHRSHDHHIHHVRGPSLNILHLTDFHYDPLYTPGNNAICDVPLCCQNANGKASDPKKAAGFWGDYRVCDIPWHSITNFTDYLLKTKEQFDFVYYTGDIISHRSWATNRGTNTQAVKDLFDHFKKVFNDTPVFPILGNHEPHPTDFYSPANVTPSISTQWIFDLMADQWQTWLPNDTIATIKQGGYYTVVPKPKFRIVALNSNVCFISNLWLLFNDIDPYDQLKWLVAVLSEAEKNQEKVHILSHIPPGELLCAQQWSNQYHQIVNRFAPIIVAQFNGHTHLDELRLFLHPNNTKQVTNVAFNAGSFTTFVGLNPNYRTYTVDPNNFSVLDYDHYTYNLTKANLNKNVSPQWFKLYSFKEAYGLADTSYGSLTDLLVRMAKNKTLVHQYYRYQGRESAPHLSQNCTGICLDKLLCTITAVETNEALKCQQLKKQKHHEATHFI